MARVTIMDSVGRNGKNLPSDVRVVQQLINQRLPLTLKPLPIDGVCTPAVIDAIVQIQFRNMHGTLPSGLVAPNSAVFRFLTNAGPSSRFPSDVIAAAKASHAKWRIPASVTLAQWADESAFGEKTPPGSNNPFGIKALAGQPYVEALTHDDHQMKVQTMAKFVKFNSLAEAFDHHGKLLATAPAYAHARSFLPDPDAFADALTHTYAGDDKYGANLKNIMGVKDLYACD